MVLFVRVYQGGQRCRNDLLYLEILAHLDSLLCRVFLVHHSIRSYLSNQVFREIRSYHLDREYLGIQMTQVDLLNRANHYFLMGHLVRLHQLDQVSLDSLADLDFLHDQASLNDRLYPEFPGSPVFHQCRRHRGRPFDH